MGKNKILLVNRLWGFSACLTLWAFFSPYSMVIKSSMIIPFLYFIIFGDTHFRNKGT